jgi:hypothetical protein
MQSIDRKNPLTRARSYKGGAGGGKWIFALLWALQGLLELFVRGAIHLCYWNFMCVAQYKKAYWNFMCVAQYIYAIYG